MHLINSIASWYLKKRIYQIEMFIKHPVETQMEVFHRLIGTAKDTEWGKKHGYADIQSVETFQSRVPISKYEAIFPEIERILKGEQNILWPGEIKWFSQSSGTTNDKSKFIPISNESLEDCHFKGGKDMLAIYLESQPNSQIFAGKGLPIGGSHQVNRLNDSSYYGDLSAVLIQNTPHVFNLFRATSKRVALIGDWESKIEAMAQSVLKRNITSIAGIPTWTLMLIQRLLEISEHKTQDLSEIWPGLEVFFHGGVSMQPYRSQLRAVIPNEKVRFFETYNASEGFFALQDDPKRDDLLLMLDYGIFYEFIRLDDLDNPHPEAFTIENVALDTTYAMVISTNAGLWRYLIGDTVKFTSLHPPRIRIEGRTSQFINFCGEELMVDNAERALAFAASATDSAIANYMAGPKYGENNHVGRHEWLIEFSEAPDSLGEFTQILDDQLKQLNNDYASKRKNDFGLLPPVVRLIPQGGFYKWMKMRDKLGGQNKVPRLSNNRDHLESMLRMLNASE